MNSILLAKRKQEIVSQLTAFSKEKYQKQELLDELLKLQDELKNVVYNDEHAKNADLRIWDVVKHLEFLNEQRNFIGSSELENVSNQCRYIGNLICAEITGRAGEKKAFYSLKNMNCEKRIIKNLELKLDDMNGEIDDVVITRKGIYIIEVKNTSKNIVIDEAGNYCRMGAFKEADYNIGEKMNFKEIMLKEALKDFGKELRISSILVFTNSSILVNNSYEYMKHCYLSQLPYIIEKDNRENILSVEDIAKISDMLEETRCYEDYPLEIDISKFKEDFASLLVKLEFGEKPEIDEHEKHSSDGEVVGQNSLFELRNYEYKKVGMAIACITTGVLSAMLLKRKL